MEFNFWHPFWCWKWLLLFEQPNVPQNLAFRRPIIFDIISKSCNDFCKISRPYSNCHGDDTLNALKTSYKTILNLGMLGWLVCLLAAKYFLIFLLRYYYLFCDFSYLTARNMIVAAEEQQSRRRRNEFGVVEVKGGSRSQSCYGPWGRLGSIALKGSQSRKRKTFLKTIPQAYDVLPCLRAGWLRVTSLGGY